MTTTEKRMRQIQREATAEVDAAAERKHTPGPWENKKWNCMEHQISAKGGTIALVSHGHTLVSETEAEANAALIAAAPDMAEALKGLLLRAAALDQSATHDGMANADALAKARAALQNAGVSHV